MSQSSIAQPTILSVLAPVTRADDGKTNWLRFTIFALLGTLAITIAARVKVPFFPVDMTLQSFVILAMSMAFGWRMAAATVTLYLIQGAIGLPVFTGTPEKGIGIAYMMGPTGGYLLGFLLAAIAVGWLAERGWDRSVLMTAAAMLIGNALIYVPGLAYLGAVLGWDKPILEWGLYPFLYADTVKMLLAMAVLPLAWQMLGKR